MAKGQKRIFISGPSRFTLARYITRRLAVLIVAIFLSSLIFFLLLRLLPGDPSNALISVGMEPDQVEAIRKGLGIDENIIFQYLNWVRDLLNFNFGVSYVSQVDIRSEVFSRLAITIPLTLISFSISLLISIPAGFFAAYKRSSWIGKIINTLTQFGIAIPVFWIGLILIYVFSLKSSILPAGGFPYEGWASIGKVAQSVILPIATIVIVMTASLTRYIRSATIDVLDSDFIRTARSFGYSYIQAMRIHGIRNAAAPVISILGIELATTFVGAVVVEQIFALPGLGSMLVKGISEHDYPVIQSILLFTTIVVLILGFMADLLQRILDPRLLHSSEVRR